MTRAAGAALAAIALLAAARASAQESPPPSSVALPAELARVLTDYEAAWEKKDASALAALFTEDGFVLSSGATPVRGRAAIEKHYAGAGGPLALRAFAFSASTSRSRGWAVVSSESISLRAAFATSSIALLKETIARVK